MSTDTTLTEHDQETSSTFTSIVVNVALVLVVSLILSLITVVTDHAIAQLSLVGIGVVIVSLLVYQFSDSLFLAFGYALVIGKPILVTSALDQHPTLVGIYVLVTVGVMFPEILRLTRHAPRNLSTSLDVLSIALPVSWMIWVSLVEPLHRSGISSGMAWAIGLADIALLVQALSLVIMHPRSGVWRPLWVGAVAISVLIDTVTAQMLTDGQAYLPILSLCSVMVSALAFLSLYWFPFETDVPAQNESTIVWRQWFIVGVAMGVILLGQLISGRGADFLPVLVIAFLAIVMGARTVVYTRSANQTKVYRITRENEIVQARRIDRLTGLLSRVAFMEDLTRMLDGDTPTLVVLADLDQFRRLNDALGPQSGDLVLANVGETLRNWNQTRFLIGRLGSNNFAIAGQHLDAPTEVIANELLQLIRGDYDLGEFGRVQLGCSVGVYETHPNDSADIAIQQAERALHQAKRVGRGTISMTPVSSDGGYFPFSSDELRMLIRRNTVVLETRPIVDLATNQTVAIQTRVALDKELGISWSALHRAARDYGIIRDLERWVLKESCQIALARRIPIWIVIQARQLNDQFFLSDIQDFLDAYRIPKDQITLSIKDRISFAEGPHPAEVLNHLRNMGVRLSLEEFGTGAFSFSQIRELPVQTLSLDGEFVNAAVKDARSRALIESVVIAANGQDVNVMATGVASQETREVVLNAGCTLANGPLWGNWTVAE